MRNRVVSAVMTLGTLALVVALCVVHAGGVGAAFSSVPPWVLAVAVALHLATLALRSEAWRLSLAAGGGGALSRSVVHGANAAAFAAGTMQSQAALPARVAVLRRVAGDRAPRAGQIFVADVPIFALELCATALLLAAGVVAGRGAWWTAAGALGVAVAVLAVARVGPSRLGRGHGQGSIARGLAVLADRRRRGVLAALVGAITGLSVLRLWLVLLVCGLPGSVGDVTWAFAALGIFGLLPLGPGAPAGATLAAFGAADVGGAVAAGLILGASSIIAVVVYALGVALAARLQTWMRVRPLAPLTPYVPTR